MFTKILCVPNMIFNALFGIGLSYGLTSELDATEVIYTDSLQNRLINLSKRLAHRQGGHNKFLESLTMVFDIDAPRYWWQEFDTYRVGVTKQSESTMHTIMSRELQDSDFENGTFDHILDELNAIRRDFIAAKEKGDEEEAQRCFLDMKAALPEGFLQRRIVVINLKTLQNMYLQRKNHRLPEWHSFFDAIRKCLSDSSYPIGQLYAYYIFGEEETEEIDHAYIAD